MSGSRRFRAQTATTTLDWQVGGGLSLRGYEVSADRTPSFCGTAHEAELTVVLTGRLRLFLGPHREERLVRAGDGILVPRGTPHLWTAERGTAFFVVDLAGGADGPAVLPARSGRAVSALAHAGERALCGAPLGALDRPVREALGSVGEPVVPGRAHDTLAMLRVLRYLGAHYTEPLRLSRLAALHGLERHYLVRAFKRNFGVPPMVYVRGLRERLFLRSLLTAAPDRALLSLAVDAGVGDYPTFCRAFRRRWGQTPSGAVVRSRR